MRRQAPYQDGDEDQIVDAEDDLQQRQREKRQPGMWVTEQRGAPWLGQVI
jgi:hypothetical protein